jgi:hypothetical protein
VCRLGHDQVMVNGAARRELVEQTSLLGPTVASELADPAIQKYCGRFILAADACDRDARMKSLD